MAEYAAGPRRRPPTHPGAIAADSIEALGISPRQAALAMLTTPQALGNVLNTKSAVSPDMALRFGAFFGNGPELWMRMQQDYDLWHARQALGPKLAKIKKAEAK
jgi:addiction module HigA family antidote